MLEKSLLNESSLHHNTIPKWLDYQIYIDNCIRNILFPLGRRPPLGPFDREKSNVSYILETYLPFHMTT